MKKETANMLLQSVSHREWPLPKRSWSYYQEWNKAIFLHWKVPAPVLQQLIPENLVLDTFENEAWISLVAFTMEKIRPKNLPAFSPISNFHEINLRTYVVHENKPGVYFLNIEAQKLLSAKLSKLLSGLPYQKARMKRIPGKSVQTYTSGLKTKNFGFTARYSVSEQTPEKTALDLWLTERYCLYLDRGSKNYRYEIHHLPWELKSVRLENLETNYRLGEIILNREPDLTHYSPGVKVLAWNKEEIT